MWTQDRRPSTGLAANGSEQACTNAYLSGLLLERSKLLNGALEVTGLNIASEKAQYR
jgi:hypothetical protein